MKNIKSKDTSIEVALRKALWKKGYRYRKNYSALPGKPDIAITKYKVAIFCDGEFFHGKDREKLEQYKVSSSNGEYWYRKIKRNIQRDSENNADIHGAGWTVLRFWGKDIQEHVDECVRIIEEAVFDSKMSESEDV